MMNVTRRSGMTALPDRGLARGRATIPGRRNRGPVDDRNVAVRNDRPPGSRVGTMGGRPFLVAEIVGLLMNVKRRSEMTALPDHGLARGRATIPRRPNLAYPT